MMRFSSKKRIALYSILFFLVILAAAVHIAQITPKEPKPIKTVIEFDRPTLPWLFNIREVTALMRKQGVIDRFGYLTPRLRNPESEAHRKCFRELAALGVPDLLRKKPDVTEFTAEDYLHGIQTLIALAVLAKPYVEEEIRSGDPAKARKAAITLSVLALNYPRGNVGNTGILRVVCADLLREMELVEQALRQAEKKAQRKGSIDNLKRIGLFCILFATDHNEKFPDSLTADFHSYFRKNAPQAATVFVSPLDSRRKASTDGVIRPSNISYAYVGKGIFQSSLRNPSRLPLAFEKPDVVAAADGSCGVLFADCHVMRLRVEGRTCRAIAEELTKDLAGGQDAQAVALILANAAEEDRAE